MDDHATVYWWLRQTTTPPAPPPSGLVGPLRLATGDLGFADDRGSVLPVFCHAGDLLALYRQDQAWACAELDDIAAAGYYGVRTWTQLWGPYWEALGRVVGPWQVGYWVAVEEFALALRARGLRWMVSQGGVRADHPAFMRAMAAALLGAGGLEVVATVDGGNEAWQTGEPDAGRLREAVNAFRGVLTVPVWSLTSPPGEMQEELDRYSGSVCDIHGYRGGHVWDKVRHAFSVAYEQLPACRFGIQSEPPGPGGLVSVTENQHELDGHAMALLSAMHLMSRQATVFFSSPGVSCRSRGEFSRQPGFIEVPALVRRLRPDLMSYRTICHGGTAWKGKRVFVAEGNVRADHAIADNGDFMCLIYGPPGESRNVPRERACEFTEIPNTHGRIVVGHIN